MMRLVQIFGTRLRTAGADRLLQASPRFAGAGDAIALANFVFEGTGTAVDTIVLFGHAFPKGELADDADVLLRRQDTNAPLRTQMNVLSRWPDNSVKTALLAAELPTLGNGVTLATTMRVGEAHPDPGPDLDLAAMLAGRSVVVRIWAPGNTTTPLWSFDPLAAIGADRWHQGPLAVSTRVMTDVPPSAVQNTAGQTGMITSVRLIVDIIATKDGILEADVCFSNDRVHHAGGGIARFGYTIEIDGEVVYDQRPATGPGRDLLQYSQWIRRYGRRASDGQIIAFSGAGTLPRPLFRPDFDLLVRSGVQTNYDRHREVTPGGYNFLVASAWTGGQGRETDPYWPWGLARGAGDVGGRTEIGYRTGPNYLWLTTGDRNAQLLAQKMFEAASTRAMYFADWDYPDRRWLDVRDWPRMSVYNDTGAVFSDVTVPKAEKVGLPANQVPTHNTTNHITIDFAHHGSFNWTPALLSGRRLCYDGLAARSSWCTMGIQFRYNGEISHALYSTSVSWRNFTPNAETGHAWGMRPGAEQTRSQAWAFRDLIDCEAILPDDYPNREFYRLNVRAWFAAWRHARPFMESFWGSDIGVPMLHGGNGSGSVNYMFSFVFYALPTAVKLGIGGPHALEVIEGWARHRAGGAASPDMNHRYILRGSTLRLMLGSGPTYATNWAQIYAKSVEAFGDVPEDWSANMGEGDYHRNSLNSLPLLREMEELPLEVRAQAADGMTLLWSERRVSGGADPYPRILPLYFFSSYANTNSVTAPGMNWNYTTAPVIPAGQTLTPPGDLAGGGVVGIIKFQGSTPRNSNPGRTPTTPAWEIVSQPADNPFTISWGGVVRLAPGKSLPIDPVTIQVRARTYEQDRGTDPNIEHVSAAVAVTIAPAVVHSR